MSKTKAVHRGIRSASEYRMIAERIPGWPRDPDKNYKDWQGWRALLAREDICDDCGESDCTCAGKQNQ